MTAYEDPRFVPFALGSIAVSTVAFIAFAAPLTWLAARDPAWARPYRLQSRPPREQQLVGPSIGWWLANNVVLTLATVASWPLLQRLGVHLGPLPPWWVIVTQVVFFVYLDDFLYYWFHRGMHTRWLYKRVHGWHHARVRGNYAGFFPIWDDVFGTLAKGYAAIRTR